MQDAGPDDMPLRQFDSVLLSSWDKLDFRVARRVGGPKTGIIVGERPVVTAEDGAVVVAVACADQTTIVGPYAQANFGGVASRLLAISGEDSIAARGGG